MVNEEMSDSLRKAVSIIGSQRNEGLEPPLYEFLRRYGPMPCTDIVLIPQAEEPSVILAQRVKNAVGPGLQWIFGGRVGKTMNYEEVARNKLKSEIGIEVEIS